MKKLLLLLMMTALSCLMFAQEIMDSELQSLIDAAIDLRGADETRYNSVKAKLAEDYSWAPMNETGTLKESECAHSVPIPRFKLNRMLTLIAGERKYVDSKGDMLNGTDDRYYYSLYERSVQAGKSVSYQLDDREGVQWFVIVPFDINSGISATISCNGDEQVRFDSSGSGTLTARVNTLPKDGKHSLTLTVNGGQKPQAFVIINYNSRKNDPE